MKQKLYIFYILIFFSLKHYGQNYIEGRIVDGENNAAINSVNIINIESKNIAISNNDGTFSIPISGEYIFKKEGYLNDVILLEDGKFYIIQLTKDNTLNEIIVNVNHIPKSLKKEVAAINIISSKDINRSNNLNYSDVLNRSPGVFMQSGALNTNKISIRGIGSRNLFGTSKIRAYFKDIPLTNGSGETTIEDLELASISNIEIIKGAASSIYGVGLGGVIHLNPENPKLNESDLKVDLSFGSFALKKGVININHGTQKNSFKLIYSNTSRDGYRENNNYNRQTITANTNNFLDENNELSILASYLNLKAFIPSSISENDFLNNPKKAAFTWKQAQGFEDSKRGLLGITWHHYYSENFKQSSSIFTSFRDAYEPRPFNILKENTYAWGLRSRLIGSSQIFKKPLSWILGGEWFNDFYQYKTFENLYQTNQNGTGSIKGNLLSNFKENRYYYNAFGELNLDLSKKTLLSFGLNLNQTSYKLKDNFAVSDDNPDQSGVFKFKNILSPKLGLSYLLSERVSLFSSVSHGFSPISLNETLLPDGQINPNLNPETGWNFELGSRGYFFNKKLQFETSIYRLDVRNLLVARRTSQDEFIGINAGRTLHDGLEMALKYNFIKNDFLIMSSFINYSLNNFKFKDFMDDENNFSGNDLTGVPSNVFNIGIDFEITSAIYGNINHQYVGRIPINDSNSLYSDNYTLTNLKLGYQLSFSDSLNLDIYFGLNNIFNTHYASQILINATSFNGSAPRYYYPGEPLNYFSGLNCVYIF